MRSLGPEFTFEGNSPRVRPATRNDVSEVWRLVLELAEYERLTYTVEGCAADLEKHAFDEKAIEIFVLEDEGEIVGYTIAFATYSTFRCRSGMWLEDLYVTPAKRGRGYGKALLLNVIQFAQERGCGRLEWSVLDWNEPAIKFYESMGADLLPDWRFCRVSMPRRSDPD